MTRSRRSGTDLLTGEWACLGLLHESPNHGFALAQLLEPTGDIGRIWSLSRPLTYRAIDQLLEREFIEARGEQPGRAGGAKTIYAPTRSGRAAFRSWVTTPVAHLRELRSDLLLKLVLAQRCSIPIDKLITEQSRHIERFRSRLAEHNRESEADLVLQWRLHSAEAALRFLADLDSTTP